MNQQGRIFRVVGWIITIPVAACLLGALALEAMGLRVTDARAALGVADNSRPIPALESDGKEALPGTTITIWFLKKPRYFGAETIFAQEFSRGKTESGELAYYLKFDEEGFNQYMHYWFLPPGDEL